jgi:hypothetical protein
MGNIPDEKYKCRWCFNCEIYDENDTRKTAICNVDIREPVEVDSEACCDFDYDETFKRW